MYFKNLNWSIDTTIKKDPIIDPKPPYQRGPVWGLSKRQLLIDSIINGFDIPKIYLRYTKGVGLFDYEVADGQQRLRAIWDFVGGVYPLGNVQPPGEDWSGKFYSELTPREKRQLRSYKLVVTTVYEATGDQIRELFARLQKGERLTPAELRNSMPGALGDIVRGMAPTHKFFVKSPFTAARHKHDDLVAHAFALELYAGTRDLKAPDLADMYKEYKSAVPQRNVANVNSALTYLAQVQNARGNCIRTKWGFVDMCWLVLKQRSKLPTNAAILADKYIAFERERLLHINNPAALLARGRSASDRDLYKYIMAFTVSGAVKENVAARQAVFVRRLT